MLNKIIKGIALKLNGIFGDDYTIYTEEIQQGLQVPCFLISHISSQSSELLFDRYYRSNMFDIQYFPKDENSRCEIEQAAEKLYAGLNHITLADGTIKNGISMNHEIEDGVLHFFVNYNNITARKGPQTEQMENIDFSIGTKEEDT